METPTILVVDGDPKNLQILRESFETAEFSVLTAENVDDAWGLIQSHKPDIILSEIDLPGADGFQFLKRLQEDAIGASIPLIFLTNRRDLEDRIKSLRTGVKDYMIKPLHVKEVIARVQMILRRINRMKQHEEGSSNKLVGRLEETSVEELIEQLGADKKTGILNLYDEHNRSGDIYFREGAVVNATLGNFKAEKAVYQMFPWRKGHFIMTFKDINVEDEISVSNLGLLLQSYKRMQERERLMEELPAMDAVLVQTPVFQKMLRKRPVAPDAQKFIALFDGKRTIADILLDSHYEDLKTLQRVVKLYEQGFVRPVGQPAKSPTPKTRKAEPKAPPAPIQQHEEPGTAPELESEPPAEQPSPSTPPISSQPEAPEPPRPVEEESAPAEAPEPMPEQPATSFSVNNGKSPTPTVEETRVRQNGFTPVFSQILAQRQTQEGYVVVISDVSGYRQPLLATLTNNQYTTKVLDAASGKSMEAARIDLPDGRSLNILGLSVEQNYLHLLRQVSDRLLGYLVVVDGAQDTKLGYLGYLINYLKTQTAAPHVVAVYRSDNQSRLSLEFLRNALRLEEKDQLIEFDAQSQESVQHLIAQLIPPATSARTHTAKAPPIQHPTEADE